MTETETETRPESTVADELAAMGAVAEAVEGLSTESRARVIGWAADLYGVATLKSPARRQTRATDDDPADDVEDEGHAPTFTEFAELVDRIKPKDEAERMIAAAFWEQVVGGKDRFGARDVNAHLKNLGRQVDHISQRFEKLIDRKPALVLQLKKAGTTKQAQKEYRLSVAGVRMIEDAVRTGRIVFPTDD